MSAFMVRDETINTIAFYTGVSAAKLVGMNADAIAQRYGSQENRRVKKTEVGDLYQFAKSLNCYLYQCSEGNVPEQPLFKHLEALAEKYRVLKSDPRYDKSYWG